MRNLVLAVTALIMLGACAEFEDDLNPEALFELDKTTVSTFELINLTNLGSGEFYTIYTGAEGSNYDFIAEGDVGIVGNQNGNASFSYVEPGVYQVAFLVTSYDGSLIKEDLSFETVTVLDTVNTLTKILFDDLGKFIRAGNEAEADYSIEGRPNASNEILLPILNFRHMGYTNRSDVPLAPIISADSEAAQITVERNPNFGIEGGDVTVSHTDIEQRYRPLIYTVKPRNGEETDYTVAILEIPEFRAFQLNDLASSYQVHPSLDNVFFLTTPVDEGQDLQTAQPEITLYYPDETSVTTGDLPYILGDPLNFEEVVSFELDFAREGYEESLQLGSQIFVKALQTPLLSSFSLEGIDGNTSLISIGNPSVYHIDVILPVDSIPEGVSEEKWVESLLVDFSMNEAEGEELVTTVGGVQTPGVTRESYKSYYDLYEFDPGSFDLDDRRKVYTVERSMDVVTDSITYSKAFSLQTIYKVGVIVQ